jgi:hypothetical protein
MPSARYFGKHAHSKISRYRDSRRLDTGENELKPESDGEHETKCQIASSLPGRVLDEVRGLFFRIQDLYRFQITRHKPPQTKTKYRNGVWLAVHVQKLQSLPADLVRETS